MKLKIISTDLRRENTKVINAETGEMLDQVGRVEIVMDANTDERKVVLTFTGIEIDITAPEENLVCMGANGLVRKVD